MSKTLGKIGNRISNRIMGSKPGDDSKSQQSTTAGTSSTVRSAETLPPPPPPPPPSASFSSISNKITAVDKSSENISTNTSGQPVSLFLDASCTSTSEIYDAKVASESEGFLLPEDQLSVAVIPKQTNVEDFSFKPAPLFVTTSYDEYTRCYSAVNVGQSLPHTVGLMKRDFRVDTCEDLIVTSNRHFHNSKKKKDFNQENILLPYCPSLSDWYSTFRSSPPDTRNLLSGRVSTDLNVLVKLHRFHTRQFSFEPLFGSVAVYIMVDEEAIRISECFHFDATTESVRRDYATCYIDAEGDNINANSARQIDFTGNCVNIADASGEKRHFHMFNLVIPQELKAREIYLVVQISKFMSSDADKAVAPYVRSSSATAPEAGRHREACERLHQYRQPVGIGLARLHQPETTSSSGSGNNATTNSASGGGGVMAVNSITLGGIRSGSRSNSSSNNTAAAGTSTSELTVPFYSQKVVWSEAQIGLALRELFPLDGKDPYVRMEALDADLKMSVTEVGAVGGPGGDVRLKERLMAVEKSYGAPPTPTASSTTSGAGTAASGVSSGPAATAGPATTTGTAAGALSVPKSTTIQPIVLPAQFQSQHAPLVYPVASHAYETALKTAPSKSHASLAVKHVLPLLPTWLPKSVLPVQQITRQVRADVDNTMYVYPTALERFKNRNLVVKVELVEFQRDLPIGQLFNSPCRALPNLYNTSYITGPAFVTEAFSRCSYHTKNPSVNDEFKIRLPDILTTRHWLKFTVLHIHVKPPDRKGSILGTMGMRASVDKLEKETLSVGVALLALMPQQTDTLLEDIEHTVKVHGMEELSGGAVASGTTAATAATAAAGDKPSMHNQSAFMSEGVIKVRTVTCSSLFSSDKCVHTALKTQPIPLGVLPSSILSSQNAAQYLYHAQYELASSSSSRNNSNTNPEVRLAQVTSELMRATPLALSRHFFVLVRQLTRTILAGTGAYQEIYCNPYKHAAARCQSFLTLLQLFGKVSGDQQGGGGKGGGGVANSGGNLPPEKLFLHAYVDFLLDEEVPLPMEDLVSAGLLSTAQAEVCTAKLTQLASRMSSSGSSGTGTSHHHHHHHHHHRPQSLSHEPDDVMDRVRAVGVLVIDADDDNNNKDLLTNAPLSSVAVPTVPAVDATTAVVGAENGNDDEGEDAIIPGMSGEDFLPEINNTGADEQGQDDDGDGDGTSSRSSASSTQRESMTGIGVSAADMGVTASASHSSHDAAGDDDGDFIPGIGVESLAASPLSSPTIRTQLQEQGRKLSNEIPDVGESTAALVGGSKEKAPQEQEEEENEEEEEALRQSRREGGETLYADDVEVDLIAIGVRSSSVTTSPDTTGTAGATVKTGGAGGRRGSGGAGPLSPLSLSDGHLAEHGLNNNNNALSILPPPPPPPLSPFVTGIRSQQETQHMRLSRERQSWGRFITDSHWLQYGGELKAVGIAGLSSRSSSEEALTLSARHLDDIALHIVAQAEKVVAETLLRYLVHAAAAEVSHYTHTPSAMGAAAHVPVLKTEDQILAGPSRFPLPVGLLGEATAFVSDRAWFQALDEGKSTIYGENVREKSQLSSALSSSSSSLEPATTAADASLSAPTTATATAAAELEDPAKVPAESAAAVAGLEDERGIGERPASIAVFGLSTQSLAAAAAAAAEASSSERSPPPDAGTSGGTVDAHEEGNDKEEEAGEESMEDVAMTIQPILPIFDQIEGYRTRAKKLLLPATSTNASTAAGATTAPATTTAATTTTTSGDVDGKVLLDQVLPGHFQHWWPWLYEVLVFQWGAVLTITLSSLKLVSTNNTKTITEAYPLDKDLREQARMAAPVAAGGTNARAANAAGDAAVAASVSNSSLSTSAKPASKPVVRPDSYRALLTEFAPVLLQVIYKSLALRISREGLRPPVQLDVQFLGALENLVMLLAIEAASFCSGEWPSRRLVSSLAAFLRALFALVCPHQVIRLIRSYFRASRRHRGMEEVELRLQMIEEIGWFDHFVAVNLPYTLDAPAPLFVFDCVTNNNPSPGSDKVNTSSSSSGSAINLGNPNLDAASDNLAQILCLRPVPSPSSAAYSIVTYTSAGIRKGTNPSPYTLAHIVIGEIMVSYKQEKLQVKAAALEVIRDLLVRHAYDARYQTVQAQQRVACMYLPVITHFLSEWGRISQLRYDSAERKDVLVILIYTWQNMPGPVLRQFLRTTCVDPAHLAALTAAAAAAGGGGGGGSAAGVGGAGPPRVRPSSPFTTAAAAGGNAAGGSNSSSRVTSTSSSTSVGAATASRVLSAKWDISSVTSSTNDKSFLPAITNNGRVVPASSVSVAPMLSSTDNTADKRSTSKSKPASSTAEDSSTMQGNLEDDGTTTRALPLQDILSMLHLILDTFECPDTTPNSAARTSSGTGSISGGGSGTIGATTAMRPAARASTGSVNVAGALTSSAASASSPWLQDERNMYAELIAPGVAITSSSSTTTTSTTTSATGTAPPTSGHVRRGSDGSSSSSNSSAIASNSNASDKKKFLDQRLQKKFGGGHNERSQIVIKSAISKETQIAAGKQVAAAAGRTVVRLLKTLLEVCPEILSASSPAAELTAASNNNNSNTGTSSIVDENEKERERERRRQLQEDWCRIYEEDKQFFLRDTNIHTNMLVGISDLRILAFLRHCTTVILHGLYSCQQPAILAEFFEAATAMLSYFGAKMCLVAMDDSLQDFMRITLYHCANSHVDLSVTASEYLLYILRASFHYLGSLTLLSNTILAVINDVVEAVLDSQRHVIRTYGDEDRVLWGLDEAVERMKASAQATLDTAHHHHRRRSSSSSSHNNGAAAVSAPYCQAVVTLMGQLQIVLQANADLRRHASHPVGYDFLGSNMLDGPWDERNSGLFAAVRLKRRLVQPDRASSTTITTSTGGKGPAAAPPAAAGGRPSMLSGLALEEVMLNLARAAEVYDPYTLPRFRMYWLENLSMLHKRNLNRAEGAEVRWRIYLMCEAVHDVWKAMWVPRPPLPWSRRGGGGGATGGGGRGVEGMSSNDSLGSNNTSNYRNSSRNSSGGSGSGSGDRSFLNVLTSSLDASACRAWSDQEQYLTHIQTTLDEAAKSYNLANLLHLVERTSFRLVHLYRVLKQPEQMLSEYQRIAEAVKSVAAKGVSTAMAIGTFYRVLYEGLGVPESLRSREFIYRNGNHMHVKEFQDSVVNHLKSLVLSSGTGSNAAAAAVTVKIVQSISPQMDLFDASVAYIQINAVKLMLSNKNNSNSGAGGVGASTGTNSISAGMSMGGSMGSSGNHYTSTVGKPRSCLDRHSHIARLHSGFNMNMHSSSSHTTASSSSISSDISNTPVEAMNQVQMFHYSVPFTLTPGKAHSKTIDAQWMNTTILTVREPFPYIHTRQEVCTREMRTYSPIEVAMNDIEERIEAMESELEKVISSPSECNPLMRIVQGTVMPQVNAGVGEVAKVFLHPAAILNDHITLKAARREQRRAARIAPVIADTTTAATTTTATTTTTAGGGEKAAGDTASNPNPNPISNSGSDSASRSPSTTPRVVDGEATTTTTTGASGGPSGTTGTMGTTGSEESVVVAAAAATADGEEEEEEEDDQEDTAEELQMQVKRNQELVMKLKMTLVDFLSCSKMLLRKSRYVLIESQGLVLNSNGSVSSASASVGPMGMMMGMMSLGGSADSSAGIGSTGGAGGSTSGGNANNGSSSNNNNNNNNNSSSSGSNANTVDSLELTREQQQFITWQLEMQRGYDTLVKSILPYLSDVKEVNLQLLSLNK